LIEVFGRDASRFVRIEAEQWGHAKLDRELLHPRQGGMLSARIIVRQLAYKWLHLAINAKIRPNFPSPLPTFRCNDVVVFATSDS